MTEVQWRNWINKVRRRKDRWDIHKHGNIWLYPHEYNPEGITGCWKDGITLYIKIPFKSEEAARDYMKLLVDKMLEVL